MGGWKTDVTGTVRDHLATLGVADEKGTGWQDALFFFGLPLLIAAAIVASGTRIEKDAAGFLATMLSIFAALLFNLILLNLDFIRRAKLALAEERPDAIKARLKDRLQLLEELHANVSFEILLSIACLVVLFMAVLTPLPIRESLLKIGRAALTFTASAITTCFVLTLLMILKRMFRLVSVEFTDEPLK